MMGVVAAILFMVILQNFLLYLGLVLNFKDHKSELDEKQLPNISVLVPARNEADNLPSCLHSLAALEYPEEKIEFILGNDGSSDQTENIMKEWAAAYPNRKYVNIKPQVTMSMNGKANALSQLIEVAKGDYFIFTDADCQVGPTWAKEMIGCSIRQQADLVTGITRVTPKNWFTAMQGLDWWLTLGMVKIFADLNYTLTSMGNNMLVSKKAYEAVGGFENLPLSVTEDFQLAQALHHHGFKAIHQVASDNLVQTEGEKTLSELMSQRKRWMRGALGLPWIWKVMLALQVLFFPCILIFMWFSPGFGLAIWLGKALAQSLFIKDFARSTGTIILPFHLISFELYYIFISWSTIVCYFWPTKIDWKERKYS